MGGERGAISITYSGMKPHYGIPAARPGLEVRVDQLPGLLEKRPCHERLHPRREHRRRYSRSSSSSPQMCKTPAASSAPHHIQPPPPPPPPASTAARGANGAVLLLLSTRDEDRCDVAKAAASVASTSVAVGRDPAAPASQAKWPVAARCCPASRSTSAARGRLRCGTYEASRGVVDVSGIGPVCVQTSSVTTMPSCPRPSVCAELSSTGTRPRRQRARAAASASLATCQLRVFWKRMQRHQC